MYLLNMMLANVAAGSSPPAAKTRAMAAGSFMPSPLMAVVAGRVLGRTASAEQAAPAPAGQQDQAARQDDVAKTLKDTQELLTKTQTLLNDAVELLKGIQAAQPAKDAADKAASKKGSG